MSRAILLKKKKKKPILLPQDTLGEALSDQYNGDMDQLEKTEAYRLFSGKTGSDGYIDDLMPPALEKPVEQSAPALKLMDQDEANSIFQNPASTPEGILQAQKYVSGNFTDVPSLSNNTFIDEQTATGILQNPNADPTELNAAREYFSGGALSDPVGSGRGEYGMPEQNYVPDQEMPTGARLDPYMNIPRINNDAQDETFDADAVLNNRKEPVSNKGKGVLNTDTTSSNDRKGSAVSSNARGSMMPFAKINRNEALMRIGGAIVGGSSQGFSGAMKAATDEFGNIQDANRQAETAAFNKAEATRLAEERIAALKTKADAKKTGNASLSDLRFGISKLQKGLEMIRGAKGNLTGVNAGAIFSRIYGKAKGSEAEAQRLFLKELGLDAIMKRVKQTKGAISNAEMKLFAASAPDINSQEIVWEAWIKRQIQMSNILINRLETGGSVDPNASLSDTMPSVKIDMGTTTTDNNAMLNEADAIIG
jgi:hypothetical protein